MDMIRKDTAKQCREIRKILRGTGTNYDEGLYYQPDPPAQSYLWIIILGVFVWAVMFWFFYAFDITQAKAQELTASWYSVESLKNEGTWSYSHGRMANGKIFKDENLTCATRLWKLGTILRITSLSSKKSVSVKVTDRIGKRFANKRIDLSKKAFKEIANLNQGLIKIRVEVL